MDLRDIQRLHAQFSTEPFTIDLPARIAALPAPEKLARATPDADRRKWASLKPAIQRSCIALAVAAVVAAAGVGSASLYKSWNTGMPAAAAPVASTDASSDAHATAAAASKVPDAQPAAVVREIDASPSQPVAMTPPMDAGSRGTPMSQGLTAEQFRQAVASRAPEATRTAAPTMSNDEQRAINSPIRRPTTARTAEVKPVQAVVVEDPDRAHGPQPPATQPAPAAPATVSPVVSTSIATASLPPHTAPAPATNQPTAAPADKPAATVKPARQPTHHSIKPRAAPSEPPTPAPEKSPSSPAHAGSNEVQMF
jgi:hypothetical protein